jgi:hypothetical protein
MVLGTGLTNKFFNFWETVIPFVKMQTKTYYTAILPTELLFFLLLINISVPYKILLAYANTYIWQCHVYQASCICVSVGGRRQ